MRYANNKILKTKEDCKNKGKRKNFQHKYTKWRKIYLTSAVYIRDNWKVSTLDKWNENIDLWVARHQRCWVQLKRKFITRYRPFILKQYNLYLKPTWTIFRQWFNRRYRQRDFIISSTNRKFKNNSYLAKKESFNTWIKNRKTLDLPEQNNQVLFWPVFAIPILVFLLGKYA